MRTVKFICLSITCFYLISCNSKAEKCEHLPKVTYNAYSRTKDGGTINRITEKGKQGLWVYTKADGSHTDTVYINGMPQSK